MAEGEAELMKKLQFWPHDYIAGLFFYVFGQVSETQGWLYFYRAVLNGIEDLGEPSEEEIKKAVKTFSEE